MKELMAKHADKVCPKDIIKMIKRELCKAAEAYDKGDKDKFMDELEDATELLDDYYTYMKSKMAV